MTQVRIVNLGLPKSGTTTLARALSEAGLKASDHKVRRVDTRAPDLAGTFIGHQIYRGYFETGDPFQYLDLYDALTEISALRGEKSLWPQCDHALVQAMRRARPDVRFIASWRPAEDISSSMLRWRNLGTERLPKATVPGLPAGFGAEDAHRTRWIAGHYAMLRDIFAGDPRYLELDMGAADAPSRLAAHIGRDVPWWGRENVNAAETPPAPEDTAA